MPRAKTTRTPKPKVEKRIFQMPENGSGSADRAELEAEIRHRAYEIYEQRGFTNGRAEQDWFEAERQVLTRHARQQHTA